MSKNHMLVTIVDPDTGSQIDYKVDEKVAYSLVQMLQGMQHKEALAWDSGCRLVRPEKSDEQTKLVTDLFKP